MTTLAEFDGKIWSAPDRPIAEPDAVAPRSSDVEIRQRMRIVGLAGTQIPAAPDPTNAAKGSTPLPYDKPSSTLSTVDDGVVGWRLLRHRLQIAPIRPGCTRQRDLARSG